MFQGVVRPEHFDSGVVGAIQDLVAVRGEDAAAAVLAGFKCTKMARVRNVPGFLMCRIRSQYCPVG